MGSHTQNLLCNNCRIANWLIDLKDDEAGRGSEIIFKYVCTVFVELTSSRKLLGVV